MSKQLPAEIPQMNKPYLMEGNLTRSEFQELVALEYVLTWNYSDNPDEDEKRYKELSNKKWSYYE